MTEPDSIEARRAAARRTAWWVAAVALAVYLLFLYMNAGGRG